LPTGGAGAQSISELTYSLRTAAVALGVSPDTVRLLVRRGELPVLRIGRRVLIGRQALADWPAEHQGAQFPGRRGA
jgi:excisionase family DNA binding protein